MKYLKLLLTLVIFFTGVLSGSAQTTIIPINDVWKYKADGSNQGTAWYGTAFSDASWSQGTAPLGYRNGGGTPQPTTPVHAAPVVAQSTTQVGYVTYYFRKTFSIPSGTYSSFTLNINRDDGFAIYINGTRYTDAVSAFNTNSLLDPNTAPTYGTSATNACSDNGATLYSYTIPTSRFLVGQQNVIAVEIHNYPSSLSGSLYYSTSSDIWFNLSLIANTNVPTPTLTRGSYMVCPTYNTSFDATITTTLSSDSITVNSGYISSLAIGMRVSGTGVGTNATITGINNTTNKIRVSVASTATNTVRGRFDFIGTITTVASIDSITVQSGYISNLAVGMTVAGTGVGANARITGINTATNKIRVSVASTLTANGVTGTFDSRCQNTIQFRTSLSCTGWVKFGTSATALNTKVMATMVTTVSMGNTTYNHTGILTVLSPNTKYFYSVGYTQGGIDYPLEATANNYFTTPPVKGDTARTRFWVCGDQGSYDCRNNMTAVKNAFESYCSQASVNIADKINGWIWLGDNAYNDGTDGEYDSAMFKGVGTFPGMAQQFKKFPVFTAPGNHDYYGNKSQTYDQHTSANNPTYINGSSSAVGNTSTTNYPYFDIFGIPGVNTATSGTKKYWSQDYGNIHMISLDSYGSIANSYSAPMMVWLRNDLIAARANSNIKFIIAFWHHPPYSRGGHNSQTSTELVTMRNFVNPLLEKYGVDLVMCGHSHQYERSGLIKGHFLYNADTASGRNLARPDVPVATQGLEEDFVPHSFQDSLGNTTVKGFYPNSNEVARPTETRGADSLNTNDTYSKTGLNGTIYLYCGSSGSCDGMSSLGGTNNAVDSNKIIPLSSAYGLSNWHWGLRQWPHNVRRMPDQLYGLVTTTAGSNIIGVPSSLTSRLTVGTMVQDAGIYKGSPSPVIPNGATITVRNITTNTVTLSQNCTTTRSSTNPLAVRFERPSIKAYNYGLNPATTQSGGCSLLMETYFTPSTGKYNLSIKAIQCLSSTTYRVVDSFILVK